MMKKLTKQKNKKLLKSCMAAALITVNVLVAASSSEAMTMASYEFEELWNGSGDAQIYIQGSLEQDDFLRVTFGEDELVPGNYIIEKDENGYKLTFKEEALKKLSLKVGYNYIKVVEKLVEDYDCPFVSIALEENEDEIRINKEEAKQVLKITNNIAFEKYEVDSKNYTITEDGEDFVIKFDKAYLSSLDDPWFSVYCYREDYYRLKLVKGDLGDVNCDGKVDLKDAQLSLKASLGIEDITKEISKLGDMDNDGKVALKDVRGVLNKALGIK